MIKPLGLSALKMYGIKCLISLNGHCAAYSLIAHTYEHLDFYFLCFSLALSHSLIVILSTGQFYIYTTTSINDNASKNETNLYLRIYFAVIDGSTLAYAAMCVRALYLIDCGQKSTNESALPFTQRPGRNKRRKVASMQLDLPFTIHNYGTCMNDGGNVDTAVAVATEAAAAPSTHIPK